MKTNPFLCLLFLIPTYASAQFTIEAEHFNFDSGQFVDDPAADAYADKGLVLGAPGIDFHETDPFSRAANEYRSPGAGSPGLPQTSTSSDAERTAGVAEYELTGTGPGEWVNYTRTFPAGIYEVSAQIRAVDIGTGPFVARLEKVDNDPKNIGQSTTAHGVFLGRNATGEYGLLPMTDVVKGAAVTIALDGEETLRFAVQTGSLDLNYLLFTPVDTAVLMPTAKIGSPADGSGHSPGVDLDITLDVSDPDAVAGVQFLATSFDGNEETIAELASPPFSTTWAGVPEGNYRLLGVVAGNDGLVGLSSEITVYVDGTAPSLASARGRTIEDVVLTFSEPMDATTAGDTANYAIQVDGGDPLEVIGASVSLDGRVVITTATQAVGENYTITMNNLTDLAGNALSTNTASFIGNGPLLQNELGFVVFEAEHYDRNLDELWVEETDYSTPSGGVSMLIPNGVGGGENETKIEYDIKFVETGTHYIWYRASSDDSGMDDSAWLHVDGARPVERADANRASMTGFNNQPEFVWRSNAQDGGGNMSFEIDSIGFHTISIARREDGARFDKFVISPYPNFDPADPAFGEFGPALTPREGEEVAGGAEVEIIAHPQDTSGEEHGDILLQAEGTGTEGAIILFQWQRQEGADWVDIPDATATTFAINRVGLEWNGVVVRMAVRTQGDQAFSNSATITIAPETAVPTLLNVSGQNQRVVLLFSEPLDVASAQDMAKYNVTGDGQLLAITGVTLLPSERGVVLETAQQVVGTKYSVTVSGIGDQAATSNIMPETITKFYSLGMLLPQSDDGLLVFEAENFDENTDGLWIEDTAWGLPSGGISVVLPNGAGGNEDSKVEYDVTFTQTGEHIIWYLAGGPSGTDDSAWFHLNGARPDTRLDGNQASMTGFAGTSDFVWRSNPQDGGGQMTFNIAEAGPHRIGLARREDGSYFDKFVITTDPNFDPTSFGPFGPPETREGAPALPTLAISAPATVGENEDATITPDISATDRALVKVEYFADGEKIGESTTAPFVFTWVNPPGGFYTVTAVLVDDVGDQVVASSIDLSVEGDDDPFPKVDGAGKSVVWISQVDSEAGDGFKELLELSEFTLTEMFVSDPTVDDQVAINAADVVVVSRKTNSGEYNNLTWNTTITAPLVLMTSYLSRDNRWQWLGGNNLVDDTPVSVTVNTLDHPVFAGLSLTDGVSEAWHTAVDRGTSFATDPIANGGTLLASAGDRMVVAEWPTDTVAVGPRMLFSAGSREMDGGVVDDSGKFNLTPTGGQAFLNAILYMANMGDGGTPDSVTADIERTANGVLITVSGAAAFDIEYSPSMAADSWTVIATDVTSFEDTDAARVNNDSGFYRGVAK